MMVVLTFISFLRISAEVESGILGICYSNMLFEGSKISQLGLVNTGMMIYIDRIRVRSYQFFLATFIGDTFSIHHDVTMKITIKWPKTI